MNKVYANSSSTLGLGRQGENFATQVIFDLSGWVAGYGDGTPELIHQRVVDEKPYPVPVERVGDTLIWTVSNLDTEVVSANGRNGRCELRYYVGETLVKSRIWLTCVSKAMGTPSETRPPESDKGWVDKVLEASAVAQEAAKRSEDALTKAPKIGDKGNWYIWDSTKGEYVDTGCYSGGSGPITPESIGAIPSSDKGKAGGVATLDSSGKVPSGQIPSLEYAAKTHASTHATGGSDPITPESIGAMDAAWNTKIVAKSQTGSSVTGWYRVLCSNRNAGANTAIVNLRHSYTHGTPCSILALVVMDAYAPKINIIESSFKEKFISVSKLRLTKDENNNVYLDYYYGMSDTNTVAISALKMCSYGDITIMDFAPVDETPTGETILVTQNLRQIPSGMIPIATIVPVTLTASAWDSSAKTQTVTVAGVLADETKQLITPAPALRSQTAYYNAGIRCAGQAANNLTFTAKTIPTTDLKVYVTIQEVGA